MSLKVALVARDPEIRLALVKAFDAAPPTWLLTLHHERPADAEVVVCGPDVELPGAIAFDPAASEDILARVAESAAPSGRAIAVTSASGGTGVTSIAIHIAAELAARRRTTCIVDVDGRWGVRHRLGLDDVPDGPPAAVPVTGGFRLLDLRSAEDRCAALVAATLDGFERVVLDVTSDALAQVRDLAAAAVLVVSPSPEGASRAAAVLATEPSFDWFVVTNRPGRGGETLRGRIEKTIGRPVDIEFPCCPALRDSEDRHGLLAHRWGRWARGVIRLVDLIEP